MADDSHSTISSLVRRAREHPDRVPLEPLSAALEHPEQSVRKQAIAGLYALSKDDPARLTDAVPKLAPLLESDSATLRSKAAMTMCNVAGRDHDAVAPHVESVIELLNDESATVRRSGVRTLRRVAAEDPEAVVSATRRLFELLESDRESVRPAILDVVERVVADVPNEVDPPVEPLIDVLDDEYELPSELGYDPSMTSGRASPSEQLRGVRGLVAAGEEKAMNMYGRENAIAVLSSLTVEDPEAMRDRLEPHLPTLFEHLDDRNPSVRGSVAGILSYVAEVDPSAVRPVENELVALLDEPVHVSGNAVWALRYVNSERAVETLRQLVDDDGAPEELRELAATALRDRSSDDQ